MSGKEHKMDQATLKIQAQSADCLKIRGEVVVQWARHLSTVYEQHGLGDYVTLASKEVLDKWIAHGSGVPQVLLDGALVDSQAEKILGDIQGQQQGYAASR